MAVADVKNYETFGWLVLLAPAGAPKPITDKIYGVLAQTLQDPMVREHLGAEPVSLGPEELGSSSRQKPSSRRCSSRVATTTRQITASLATCTWRLHNEC